MQSVRISVLALLLLAGLTVGKVLPDRKECGLQTTDRIIGGDIALPNYHPWASVMGYLVGNRVVYGCGGTLIHREYVLTAAHCCSTDFQPKEVILGKGDLLGDKDCDPQGVCFPPALKVRAEKCIVHENFDNVKLTNDIALVKLSEPVNYTETVRPACIADSSDSEMKRTEGVEMVACGWGTTENSKDAGPGYGSRYKRCVKLTGVTTDKCPKKFENILDASTQFCAGGVRNKDTCQGDSGGGLVAEYDSYHYVNGIVSYGYRCGLAGMSGVYTKVRSFVPWILQNIQN